MKTRIILAILLMVLLISCGQPETQMEEAPKAEPIVSTMPPPPEVEPPASSPYEHENTTA